MQLQEKIITMFKYTYMYIKELENSMMYINDLTHRLPCTSIIFLADQSIKATAKQAGRNGQRVKTRGEMDLKEK